MNKLKPCPFCGSTEEVFLSHYRGCFLRMMEEKEGEGHIPYSQADFFIAWNTRVKGKDNEN